MNSAGPVNQSHQLNQAAESIGFFWKRTPKKGLLEYRNSKLIKFLIFCLIGWGVVALFPLLFGNPGLTRLKCVRTAPNVGNCQLEKIYLHPFLVFFSGRQELPLSEIVAPQVHEIVGDESDSYQLVLQHKRGDWNIMTAMFEETAENAAEDIQVFLRSPQEELVKVRYFDTLFFWIMYLPLYLMLFYLGMGLFLKLTGKPFNCYWLVLDGETRQVVVIRNTALGWSLTQKHAVGAVTGFTVIEQEGENTDYIRLQMKLKSGPAVNLTPLITAKDSREFEDMQDWLLDNLNQTLNEFQGRVSSSGQKPA
ncbi:MAG: hypothetical protein IV090_23630 [Candidatus Sericytochromatia bacterium]|nr:hypothetical protein [Candidatus Sericytochromatia bacterium]